MATRPDPPVTYGHLTNHGTFNPTTYQQVANYRAALERGWAKYKTLRNGKQRTQMLAALRQQESTLQSMWHQYQATQTHGPQPGTMGSGNPANAGPGAVPASTNPADVNLSLPPSTATILPMAPSSDALASLKSTLSQYGLSSLGDWAWSELTSGKGTDQVLLELRDQPAFKQRFPGMEARRQAGLNAISIDEYLSTEREYQRELLAHGQQLPRNPQGYVDLFAQDIHPTEFKTRLDDYFKMSQVYGPYVKNAFQTHLGLNLNDSDLYGLVSGLRPDLAQQYSAKTGTQILPGMGGKLGLSGIENAMTQAENQNQAEFKGGGTFVPGQQTASTYAKEGEFRQMTSF